MHYGCPEYLDVIGDHGRRAGRRSTDGVLAIPRTRCHWRNTLCD